MKSKALFIVTKQQFSYQLFHNNYLQIKTVYRCTLSTDAAVNRSTLSTLSTDQHCLQINTVYRSTLSTDQLCLHINSVYRSTLSTDQHVYRSTRLQVDSDCIIPAGYVSVLYQVLRCSFRLSDQLSRAFSQLFLASGPAVTIADCRAGLGGGGIMSS